jgi:phage host-nuclease inhibitor protein Gam
LESKRTEVITRLSCEANEESGQLREELAASRKDFEDELDKLQEKLDEACFQ